MNRRAFLAALGLAPAVAKAAPAKEPLLALDPIEILHAYHEAHCRRLTAAWARNMQRPSPYINRDVLFDEPMSIHEALREFGA